MASVKLYKKTGDKKAVSIQTGIEKEFGFVPEVFQAMGSNGEFLDSMLKLAGAAGKNLDSKTKELISIAVSAVNGCHYCIEAHRTMALKAGVKDEEITGALEVAAMMSAFNNFNKGIGLKCDIVTKK